MTLTREISRPGNLPVELTSFVGRRQELADLKRILAACRLLTLTGAGGVGKTKLSLHLSHGVARSYPAGVWFVDLAPVADPQGVVQAVVASLGLQDRSTDRSLGVLAEHLTGKRLLLVLDNCEHILDATAVLAGTLLRACPDLRILATSRQALGVTGEVVVDVPPLSLPSDGDVSAPELMASDAGALFAERAAAAQPGFATDPTNVDAILRICRRLDGLPLALELAAVRLNALGLDALNRGLADRLGALGAGDRSASLRQRTLDATIDWSYRLLDPDERLLWERLSVFSGGFELDAAVTVCADDRLPAHDIPGLVGGLVEKSVLKRRTQTGADRFRFLEPIRQFGRDRLREAGTEAVLRIRHRDWIASLARVAGAEDASEVELFARLGRERANVWSVIDFVLGDPDQAEVGVAICCDLWVYWTTHGPNGEVRRVFDTLIDRVSAPNRARARALATAATFAFYENDFEPANAMLVEALAIGRAIRDVDIVGRSLGYMASVAWAEGRSANAIELGQESFSLARTMGAPQDKLRAGVELGFTCLGGGRLEEAAAHGVEAIAISEALGETWHRGLACLLLAATALARGAFDDAAAYGRRALVLQRDLDDRASMAPTIAMLATVETRRGSTELAATLLGVSEALSESVGTPRTGPWRSMYQAAVEAATIALGPRRYAEAYESGRAMSADDVVDLVVDGRRPEQRRPIARLAAASPLSPRESEVAGLVAAGASNAEVAARLFISERTVESHLASIFNKLGVNSRMQVARWVGSTSVATPA